eukprot:363067-Chlamydomonas_euryale.AAC.5
MKVQLENYGPSCTILFAALPVQPEPVALLPQHLLNRLSRLGSPGVRALAAAGPTMCSLRELHLRHCRNITEPAVVAAWQALPRLAVLELEGSWFVELPTIVKLHHGW